MKLLLTYVMLCYVMAKVKAYSVPDEEIKMVEKILFEIGKLDRWSDSRIVVEALKEYAKRHLPGNPQLIMPNFIPELKTPFSVSATEKLAWGNVCEDCGGSGKTRLGAQCSNCAGLGRIGNGEKY